MTVAATTRPSAPNDRQGPLTGTLVLARFMLRRDRLKLPAWVAGLGLFVLYVGVALPQIAPTEEGLAVAVPMVQEPIGRMFTGPAYGLDAPTYERFFAGGYLIWLLVLAALMNILLVTRHTRGEEQSGRAELVRADAAGRHAALTAALTVALVANVLAAVVVAALAMANGFAAGGSVLMGVTVAAVGMTFAAITAVTVQLTEYSRSAAGLAGAVLGLAFMLRALGDMTQLGGSTLSWLSPLGWGSQTAPYVLDRWWPLVLHLALTVAAVSLAYWLQSRRDLGAGLMAARPGRREAHPSLGTPWGLAARLQRGAALGWGAAIVILGVVDGLFAQVMIESAADLPEAMQEMFGVEAMALGYLAFLAIFNGYLTAAYVVYAVQTLRTEESRGRAETVLATPTSRASWAGAHLGVIGLQAVGILLVAGVLTGLAAAAVTSDGSLVWQTTLAHLNVVPAVLVVLGLCALLHGWVPSLLAPVGWAVVGIMVFAGNFAALLDLPDWVVNLSPLSHVARVPVEDLAWAPVLVLTALALLGLVLGLAGLARREVAGRS